MAHSPLRRAVICPLLAVATTHRLSHYRSFQQAQPDGHEGPPPFPRVLTGFSTRPPVASVLRDEQGAPLHKRVKVGREGGGAHHLAGPRLETGGSVRPPCLAVAV